MEALLFSIGIFKRELLIETESFRIILGISVVLFLVGLFLHFTAPGRHFGSGALLCPLLSLGLYRLCRRVFIRQYNREPRDTWFDWSEGMGADRIFNILYFGSVGWLLMLLAAFIS
jgi:hypothetical protein